MSEPDDHDRKREAGGNLHSAYCAVTIAWQEDVATQRQEATFVVAFQLVSMKAQFLNDPLR